MKAAPAAAPAAAERAASAGVPAWIWILLLAAGTVATVTDLRAMRIPNWLTLPLLAGGLVHAVAAEGLPGLSGSLAGAAAAGAMFVAAYAMLGGGAGDAKLMLALGSWLGFEPSLILVVAVTLVGFVLAIGAVVARGGIRDVPGVVFVGVVRTLGGMMLLRRGIFVGATHGAAQGGATSASQQSPGKQASEAQHRRPKGWLPYAPAILAGTALAWLYIDVLREFGRVH